MRGLRTSFFRADHRGPGRAEPIRALWTVLATSAALALTSPAEAALYYWPSYSSVYVQPVPPPPPSPWRAKIRRHAEKKIESAAKETAKPQGPLIIAISIEKQNLKLYDANGLFAESPVSTGMRGHPTPLGVFSVIQKQKMHRSNIYSGAPMPYMQRITWSGVALHAGVLPGYPASHGCIRMPTAFAIKMWAWTRMGARVIITPGEITPAAFSHPLLASRKPAPPSAEAGLPPAEPKSSQAGPQDSIASAAASAPELRTTLGHEDIATPGAERAHPTRTADADSSSASPPATLSDAGPSSSMTLPPNETPKTDNGAPAAIAPKDPSRSGEVPAAKADPAPPKRIGQTAVFVSRKDAKLYVRQNFEPLFDVPVTIASSEHPLGTHVFTAEVDKADPSQLHWSVISLPPANRHEADTAAHKRKIASAAETGPAVPPDSAGEALDRLSLPAEAMSRIAELLSNGSSIIVSDLGIGAGETGEGTDFIVPLR